MLESIYNFLNQLILSKLSFMKVVIRSKYFLKFPQTTAHEIIILGTGPSLKKTLKNSREKLMRSNLLGLNHFADKDDYEILKPNFYTIGAPSLYEENLSEYYDQKATNLFTNIAQKTNWDLTLFISKNAKNSPKIKLLDNNKNISIVYYNDTPIDGLFSISKFFFNLKLGMPRPHNVLIPSIFCSIWSGFRKIIIIGGDHSWHEELKVTNENIVLLNQKHYFDTEEHWKPMNKNARRDRKLFEIFEKWMLSHKAYVEIEHYATKINVEILNGSSKSYIDAFKKIKLTNET